MFTPENELEQAMQQAAASPSHANEFYRQLLESELIVLGTKGDHLAIDAVRHGSGFFHPIFTSSSRLAAFTKDAVPTFSIHGRDLFEATRGSQFLINPRSSLAKTLYSDEIDWCLETFCTINLAVVQPDPYPTQLVKALCVLFTSRSQLQRARLAFLSSDTVGIRAVVGIESDGDVARLAREIFQASALVGTAYPVDVVPLKSEGPLHPVQKHLLTVRPFFERLACDGTTEASQTLRAAAC